MERVVRVARVAKAPRMAKVKRPAKREEVPVTRMARLDVTGTPAPVEWFRTRFEIGLPGHERATLETLKHYFSMRVRTRDNTRLTNEQIDELTAFS